MYTQCPNCSTIFSMTEEDLGAHQGLVRCGRCKEVFNASWNLVDGLPGKAPDGIEAVELGVDHGAVADAPDTEQAPLSRGMKGNRIVAQPQPDPIEAFDPGTATAPDGSANSELYTAGFDEKGGAAGDNHADPDGVVGLRRQSGTETVGSEPPAEFQNEASDKQGGSAGEATPYQHGSGVPPPHTTTDKLTPVAADKAAPTATAGVPVSSSNSRFDQTTDSSEVDEEIIIEAPSRLWILDEADDDTAQALEKSPDVSADTTSITPAPQPVKKAKRRLAGKRLDQGQLDAAREGRSLPSLEGAPEPRRIPASARASDVKLVEIPYPRPVRNMLWLLASVVLTLGLVWQIKNAYLSELAQIPSLRGPLAYFCQIASCALPPRTDFKSIDLISTSVDPHPVAPGALRVSANLVNRAKFRQPFPPLEITLTDKEGAVVGRRTYLPHEYGGDSSKRMLPNVLERVNIDLAQPAESAVGYEIQLVVK